MPEEEEVRPLFDEPMDVFSIYGAIQKEDLSDFSPEEAEKLFDEFIDFVEERKMGFGGGFGYTPEEENPTHFRNIVMPSKHEFIKGGLVRIMCDLMEAELDAQEGENASTNGHSKEELPPEG